MVKEDISKSIPEEVPVFLRKTFVMIDSSPKDVAGWDETGEMFVIRDPDLFEQTIIPQFFKHSKFSSFVRQLNFYSFRKIKNVDMIRIDPQLEAEVANHWRFRHEYFRQGRPDLLPKIKRTNAPKASSTNNNKSDTKQPPANSNEVQVLKKRIEEMSKHMDELTSLVQKVSLKQEEHQNEYAGSEPGQKRKKQDIVDSLEADDEIMTFDLDAIPEVNVAALPQEEATATDFEALFDDDELQIGAAVMNDKKPDSELMERLSDALMLLPREIQEIIVDKLVEAIMGAALPGTKTAAADDEKPEHIPRSPQHSSDDEDDDEAFPLAATTLAALLQHCGAQLSGKKIKNLEKAIPVIPIHA